MHASVGDDAAWESWRVQWSIRPDTIYLNHGSFGPPPLRVQQAQRNLKDQLDSQPLDFLVRHLPVLWQNARKKLADFVRAPAQDLVFVENSTQAMNIVANSFPLEPGQEVLLTDHEYGAVKRIWSRRCEQSGSVLREVSLPQPIETVEQVVAAVVASISDKTRLLVVSHITSPTAIILPIAALCEAVRKRGVAICVDGPHAPAQIELDLSQLDCDFYAASCHKWLSAPLGSGFLYVAPRWQRSIKTPQLSWGVLRPAAPERWDDEFQWPGTRDPTAYLAVPAAIEFLEDAGLEAFRNRIHFLARHARHALLEFADRAPLVPDDLTWYGSMAHVPLPDLNTQQLQQSLWQRFGIEVPIVEWSGRCWIRVSCHLYTRQSDIDLLVRALRELL